MQRGRGIIIRNEDSPDIYVRNFGDAEKHLKLVNEGGFEVKGEMPGMCLCCIDIKKTAAANGYSVQDSEDMFDWVFTKEAEICQS